MTLLNKQWHDCHDQTVMLWKCSPWVPNCSLTSWNAVIPWGSVVCYLFRYHLWVGLEKDSERNKDKEEKKTNEWKLIEDKEKEKRKRR